MQQAVCGADSAPARRATFSFFQSDNKSCPLFCLLGEEFTVPLFHEVIYMK